MSRFERTSKSGRLSESASRSPLHARFDTPRSGRDAPLAAGFWGEWPGPWGRRWATAGPAGVFVPVGWFAWARLPRSCCVGRPVPRDLGRPSEVWVSDRVWGQQRRPLGWCRTRQVSQEALVACGGALGAGRRRGEAETASCARPHRSWPGFGRRGVPGAALVFDVRHGAWRRPDAPSGNRWRRAPPMVRAADGQRVGAALMHAVGGWMAAWGA